MVAACDTAKLRRRSSCLQELPFHFDIIRHMIRHRIANDSPPNHGPMFSTAALVLVSRLAVDSTRGRLAVLGGGLRFFLVPP